MMDTAGSRLKKLRLEKGITLEEVSKKTKVHLNILKSIEEDSLLNLNSVYVKGFLKIYCKFLNADPRDFIPGYKDPQEQAQFRYLSGAQEKPLLKSASVRLDFSGIKNINKKMLLAITLAIVFVIVLFHLGKFISARRHSSGRVRSSAVLPLRAEARKETASLSAAPAVKIIRLGILAKEDCLVQLKSDGHSVFKGILKKGRSETWQAKDKIELFLGNAGVVELEVNGKRITNLGRRGRPLKNILITKEGLTIAGTAR